MPFATRPVYVVPDQPLTRQDFAEICRYHFEGTEIDQTDAYSLMTPHDQTNRPVCDATTDYSAVWQLRDWLPDAIGGVMWVAPSRPCSSAYVPFYDSITSVPAGWTDATAYAGFRAVADNLDKKGKVNGVRRYKYYSPLVRSTYGAFESSCTNAQSCVESTAAGLCGSARIQLPEVDGRLRGASDVRRAAPDASTTALTLGPRRPCCMAGSDARHRRRERRGRPAGAAGHRLVLHRRRPGARPRRTPSLLRPAARTRCLSAMLCFGRPAQRPAADGPARRGARGGQGPVPAAHGPEVHRARSRRELAEPARTDAACGTGVGRRRPGRRTRADPRRASRTKHEPLGRRRAMERWSSGGGAGEPPARSSSGGLPAPRAGGDAPRRHGERHERDHGDQRRRRRAPRRPASGRHGGRLLGCRASLRVYPARGTRNGGPRPRVTGCRVSLGAAG